MYVTGVGHTSLSSGSILSGEIIHGKSHRAVSVEGLRATVDLARISGFAGDAGVVWGRAWMPSDVCARRSCATRSSEAEIAPSRLCQLYLYLPTESCLFETRGTDASPLQNLHTRPVCYESVFSH